MFDKKQSANTLGVALSKRGVAYCHLTEQGDFDSQQLKLVENDYAKTLNMLGTNLGLSGKCHLVLAPNQYQIVQIDKPNVEEEELNQAIKWQIKELVTTPPGDMVVDYFDGPIMSGGAQKLNVVCTTKNDLVNYVAALNQQQVEISSISIEEFAFANLIPPQDDAHLLLVQQPNEELIILIVKQGQIFFHRRLRGFSEIADKTSEELSFGMVDSISLEIQRSTDYFERQLKQAPIKSIQVLIPNDNEAFIARKLSENTNVAVEMLNMPAPFTDERGHAVSLGLIIKHMPEEQAQEAQS